LGHYTYDLHAQSPCVNPFRGVYDHRSSYRVDVCCHCYSFDHDVNSCPYHDIFNEAYARLNAMIETMNESQEHFVSEMREFILLYETDPSLPVPKLESCLCDDYESFFPLESNIFDNAPLTDLKEVFDSPLTSLPLVLLTRPYLPLPSL